jgi:hypothetical protein
MFEFSDWYGFPGVVEAIDTTHFDIKKPTLTPEDYFYFKSRGYFMQCKVVADRNKLFLDVVVGMLGSTNDSRVLKCSSLYKQATSSN